MKTKIIVLALAATFALTLLTSCSNDDCNDICPTEKPQPLKKAN